MPLIGILRHTLYLPSERFIPDQARALRLPVLMLSRDPIVNNVTALNHSVFAANKPTAIRYTVFGDTRPLQRVIIDRGIHLLHAHFGVEGMSSVGAAKAADIPHFTTLHGYDVSLTKRALLRSGSPSWIRFAASRRSFFSNNYSFFICVSHDVRRQAIQLGAPEGRTLIIPTGVDTSAISVEPLPRDPVIVHVARLVEKKGTRYLIRAAAKLIDDFPDLQLRIIGEGPLKARLQQLVDQLSIQQNVVFLGALSHSDVFAELRRAWLLCQPSVTARSGDKEGLGQAILEAGAMGRPVVATRNGGIIDAVQDTVTGLLVEERNVPQLRDSLRELLRNRELSTQIGLNARAFIVKNFDIVNNASIVGKNYSEVLRSGHLN